MRERVGLVVTALLMSSMACWAGPLKVSSAVKSGHRAVSRAPADTPVPQPEIRDGAAGKEVWIDTLSGPAKLGDLEVIPIGAPSYHWADPENSARWASQGHVDDGEMRALDGGSGAVGGGFYVSEDLADSRGFGAKLTVFTTTQEVRSVSNLVADGAKVSILDWGAFNQKLQALGIDGVGRYNNFPNWFNFVDAKPLLRAHAATWADLEASAYFKAKPFTILSVLDFSTRIPIQNTPWMRQNFPFIFDLLKGTCDLSKLDNGTLNAVKAWLMNSVSITDNTPLVQAARAKFLPLIKEELKSKYAMFVKMGESLNSLQWTQRGMSLDELLQASKRNGISFPSGYREARCRPIFFLTPIPWIKRIESRRLPQAPFGKDLAIHLEYLDYPDFLHAIATGQPTDKIYDEPGKAPYVSRWGMAKFRFMTAHPLEGYQILTDDPVGDFRDAPVSSDGDLDLQGRRLFRVSERQKLALQKNPFIQPEFARVPDPVHAGQFLEAARYDYATAIDYQKFSAWLSPDFTKELEAAKAAGTLTDPASAQVRGLTKKMMGDLMTNLFGSNISSFMSPLEKQVLLTSIHPFGKMNTEAIANAISGTNFFQPKIGFPGNRGCFRPA